MVRCQTPCLASESAVTPTSPARSATATERKDSRAHPLSGRIEEGAVRHPRSAKLPLDADLESGSVLGAILVCDEGDRFRAYFPQELGHYVAEVVLDAIDGLDNR